MIRSVISTASSHFTTPWTNAVRELPQQEILAAALLRGRMTIVAMSDESGGMQLVGVRGRRATGQRRVRANPLADGRAGTMRIATMQFEANSPSFQSTLFNGLVMRLNSLTGHEQRRFLAEWRTPEQQKAGRPEAPEMQRPRSAPTGSAYWASSHLEWIYVLGTSSRRAAMRRKFRHPHGHGCKARGSPPTAARWRLRTFGTTSMTSARLPSGCMTSNPAIRSSQIEPGERSGRRVDILTEREALGCCGFDRGSGIVWDVRRGLEVPRSRE